MRHFLKDNIAAADFTGVMNTMAGYGDCVAANASMALFVVTLLSVSVAAQWVLKCASA